MALRRIASALVMRARLSNGDLAELLAQKAETSSGILVRAFRRAARSAFLWPELAADLIAAGRPLTELHGVGPFIARQLQKWIENPPRDQTKPPSIRPDFLTRADARLILAAKPEWSKRLHGDLQIHTGWSDASASIVHMADPGLGRGRENNVITVHAKGLEIGGG